MQCEHKYRSGFHGGRLVCSAQVRSLGVHLLNERFETYTDLRRPPGRSPLPPVVVGVQRSASGV
jgi:hypothetical protein